MSAPPSPASSYQMILRSSSVMGVASVLSVALGVVRMKAAAVLLGPTGLGLFGMYLNLLQTGAAVASLGLDMAGTRRIAAEHGRGDSGGVELARRALLLGTLSLAVVGGGVFAGLSGWIAAHVLGDPGRAAQIRWLALGIALAVAAASQSALLMGLRRIGDLARIQIGAAATATALGVAALWAWGESGLLVMVLAVPAATLAQGLWYTRRLRRHAMAPTAWPQIAAELRTLVRLGTAFMLSGAVNALGQLSVRGIVQRSLGADALGYFQAAWDIGMVYLGFVLGAMATDYYPRLAATMGDARAATRLVNEQTEVALLLSGPALLALLGTAPWVIHLLYSPEFAPAAHILRWQLLGDVLKVMSWPLGFVLLAAGAGKTFVVAETLGIGVFVAATALGVKPLGPIATGWGFLIMHLCYLPFVYALARARIGFRWQSAVWRQGLALFLAAAVVSALGHMNAALSAFVGIASAIAFGLHALLRLTQRTGLDAGPAAGMQARLVRCGQMIRRTLGRKP